MRPQYSLVAALAVAGTVTALSAAMPAPAAAEAVSLKLHTFVPPVASTFRNLKAWAHKVETESNQSIKITLFASMQLGGKPPDLYNQVRDGVVNFAWTLPGYTPGTFPRAEVFELPFVGGSGLATTLAVTEFYPKWLVEEFSAVHPVILHAPGAVVLHVKTRPVRRMEDLKGLKIRTPSRPTSNMFKALGAVPVGIPGARTTEAVIRGVVDGAIYPWAIARANRMIDETRYHTEGAIHNALLSLLMNKATYAKLSAANKKVIDANSHGEQARLFGIKWSEDDKAGIARAKKLGHPIIKLSAAERERWKKASQGVIDAWIADMTKKGHPGQALVDDATRLVEKYEKEAMMQK